MCDLEATVSNCRRHRCCVCMCVAGFCFGYDCVLPQTKIKSARGFTVSNNFGHCQSEVVVIVIWPFFAIPLDAYAMHTVFVRVVVRFFFIIIKHRFCPFQLDSNHEKSFLWVFFISAISSFFP